MRLPVGTNDLPLAAMAERLRWETTMSALSFWARFYEIETN
ncbi:MAG: hypothetical protein ABSA97_07640 [Verrucomicrobiia bacterium]